jgi:hypothetical protein
MKRISYVVEAVPLLSSYAAGIKRPDKSKTSLSGCLMAFDLNTKLYQDLVGGTRSRSTSCHPCFS